MPLSKRRPTASATKKNLADRRAATIAAAKRRSERAEITATKRRAIKAHTRPAATSRRPTPALIFRAGMDFSIVEVARTARDALNGAAKLHAAGIRARAVSTGGTTFHTRAEKGEPEMAVVVESKDLARAKRVL